jgi:alpha-beta hydrolase superfamily lysophospholipase
MSSDLREIHFFSDRIKLHGYLHIPENFSNSVVIGSHGLLSDASSNKQTALAEELSKHNIGYLRFNHRGCGKSGGNLEDSSLFTRKKDILAAHNYLKENFNISKTGLFGSSMGGATCIFSSKEISPCAMVLVASPVIGKTMKDSFTESIDILMEETGLSKNFFEKNIDFDLLPGLDKIINTLVIHGDKDEIVPFKNGEILYSAIGNEKKLIRVESGDHRITNPKDQKTVLNEAVNWFVKFLN